MRFTITTAIFVLCVSTVFASPLPIDGSLEGINVPAARSAVGNVERRAEPANLEMPNRKRKEEWGDPDWKRAKALAPDWKRAKALAPDWKRSNGVAKGATPDFTADWKRNVDVASPLS